MYPLCAFLSKVLEKIYSSMSLHYSTVSNEVNEPYWVILQVTEQTDPLNLKQWCSDTSNR